MTRKKQILIGIGVLVFLFLIAINVQLVQSWSDDPMTSNLKLVELSALANGGGDSSEGGFCNCYFGSSGSWFDQICYFFSWFFSWLFGDT